MNLKELQAFVELAENLHFSNTANKVHVSPSTLSRMMQRLEEEFGQTLFERDNRSVRLTEHGKRFAQFAQNVLSEWQLLQQDFSHNSTQLTGELSIYSTVTAAHLYLTQLLDEFRRLYPKVEVILETGDVSLAYQKVEHKEVDVAFAVAQDNLAKKFSFLSIDNIPLKVIGPTGSCAFAEELNQSPIDWKKLPFVMPESGPAKKHTQSWMKAMGFKPSVYAQVVGHEAIVSMTALGCGVSVVPLPVLEHSPVKDKVKILPVSKAPQPFDLGVICLTRRFQNPLIQAFWTLVSRNFER